MRRSLLLGTVVLLFASVALAADVDKVTLKNGDRFSGTIVSGDGKTLLLKTEFAGDITIEWDAVTAIDSSQDLHLTLKDGQQLSGKVSTTDGKFVITGPGAAAAPAEKDSIVAVRNDVEHFWSGLLDTGLALTSGNSSTLSYTLATTAVRETPRDKLTVYSTYVYANDNSTPPTRTTANYFRGGVRGDLNVSPRVFIFALADFETNQLQHLNLRQVYGGGFGYHVIKSDRTTFDVFGGASYDRDSFGQYFLLNPLTFFPGQTDQQRGNSCGRRTAHQDCCANDHWRTLCVLSEHVRSRSVSLPVQRHVRDGYQEVAKLADYLHRRLFKQSAIRHQEQRFAALNGLACCLG